jgi:DNA-binding NarL/FixJ family response regulator
MTYDAVLMDLQMPGLDGYDTTREIIRTLRDAGRAAPPIVALSAHALTSSLERSIDAGCAQTLTKPIRKRVLVEAIAHVVSGKLGDEGAQDDLSPLLPQFFANRRKDVVTIADALDKNDFDVIATLAHNMRGTGTSFGFPELSAVGDELEKAARAKSLDACRAGHAKLAEIVAKIQPG